MRVIAYGALQQRSFEGRDGAKRTVIELAVEEVGPSLRYASARITQLDRSSQPAGDEQDVWASSWDTEPTPAN